MRPLKLRMTAFGPYADTEIVDFNELNERNLFLITGPTGSGKTTIFDAICFAMYGETNGNVRTAESLRSQFADEKKLTEIELEFELRGTKYNIHRIPRQQKPKARGQGFTEQKADATLTIDDSEEPKVIAGVKNVNDRIESVIGINAEQFRQIMMIPQGQFRKLLTADSQERERVLQRLFDTSIYNTIQMKMDINAKSLSSQISKGKAVRDNVISRINYNDGDKLSILINSQDRNIAEIINETALIIEKNSEALVKIDKEIDAKNRELHRLIEAKEKTKENNEKLKTKGILKKKIQEEKLREDEIESFEKKVKDGERARLILPIEKNYNLRKIEYDAKDRDLSFNVKEFEKTKEEFKKAEGIFKKAASEQAESIREKLLEELAKLRGYEEKVKNIKVLKESINKAKGNYEEIEKKKQMCNEEIKKLKLKKESLGKAKDNAQDAGLKAEKAKSEIVRLEDIVKKLERAFIEYKELLHIENKVNDKKLIIEGVKKELVIESEGYKKMKISFHMNQAAILAKELKEGSPCPVCGSKHHEKLAEFTDNVPTERELNTCEEKLRKSEEEYNDIKIKYAELKERQSQKHTGCMKLISELHDELEIKDNNLTIQNILHLIQLKQKENMSLLNKSKKRENEFLNLSEMYKQYIEEISKIEKKIETIEGKGEGLAGEYIEASKKYTHYQSLLEGIYREVPQSVRQYDKLKVVIGEKEALRDQMIKALKQAQESYEAKKSELAVLKSKCEQIQRDKVKLKKVLEEARMEFKDKCLEAGFKDYNHYNRSRIKEDELAYLKKKIDDYYKQLHALKQQYDDILKKTEGLTPVDILTFDESIKAKNEEHKVLIDKRGTIINKKKNNQKLLEEIEEIQLQIGEKEKRYRLIGHLAKIAKGDNRARITFERYVLAAFLEDILIAANIRLRKMTGGRYGLLRTAELERKNKQSGLELEVFDNYTGKSRHVKTLSGGESFKASLSMALGLSDVVQSYAGGVRLDTMFIDEGFGTLDPESLDHAISCLIDLQKSGRLVGIISHVPELKERIDARLEVHSTNTGSVTKFAII
jgi:exonuclease SbcC